MRVLIAAALFGAVVYGDDITIPLADGTILISAQFISQNKYGSFLPELALRLKNQTSSSWRALKFQFDIGGLCNGEPRQWTVPVVMSLGWAPDRQLVKELTDTAIPLVGKVDGCKTEIIRARLVFAENSEARIEGATSERVDFGKQLLELKAKYETEAAARAEEERQAAEAQAKKDAGEVARKKLQAEEQQRKLAEIRVQLEKLQAEENAKAAEERRKTRANCRVIYRNTIDKKVKDLTVREEQQVRTCQALGLYPPH